MRAVVCNEYGPPELAARDERELIELPASGALDSHISAVYDFDHVADALNAVAGRRSTGKVLLRGGAEHTSAR